MRRKKAGDGARPTGSITVGDIVGSQGVAVGQGATASSVTAGQLTALDNAFAQVRSRYTASHGQVPEALEQALRQLQEATAEPAASEAGRVRRLLDTIRTIAPPVLDILGQVLGGLPAIPGVASVLAELGRAERPE